MRDDLDEMGLHVGALDEGREMPEMWMPDSLKEVIRLELEREPVRELIPGATENDDVEACREKLRAKYSQPTDYPKPETPIVQWLKQQKAKGAFVRIDDVLEQLDA